MVMVLDEHSRIGSASLAQLAKLLGQSEEEVLAEATRLIGDGAADRGWVRADAVSELIIGVEAQLPLSGAESLLKRAFRQAEESGKTDWTSMAIPVLKNRLIQLSSNTFDEAEYGSPNIWHFVTRFPHLLGTDGGRMHERVHLLQPELVDRDTRETPAELDPVAGGRIRDDLWRAVFDYSAGAEFVWDENLGRARARSDRDTANAPIIPTLSSEDMRGLRREFVDVQERVNEHDAARLGDWAERGGGTAALPRLYRGLWNAHLKSHAANSLRAFFLSHGLSVPQDLFGKIASLTEPENDVEHARRLAHRYIDAMTGEELARLSIELSVITRVPLNKEG